MSVPLYLEISTPRGWYAASGPFYYCDPEILSSDDLDEVIRVEINEDFVLVWSIEETDTILAVVDFSQRIVYPPSTVCDSSYYEDIDDMLSRIKRSRHDDRLRLKR
ncbi:MAG: hypothetical protein U9N87_14880 [Planctomycetota bacterium]|nr:hypothetical protein [Planctomycetota bacterium]